MKKEIEKILCADRTYLGRVEKLSKLFEEHLQQQLILLRMGPSDSAPDPAAGE